MYFTAKNYLQIVDNINSEGICILYISIKIFPQNYIVIYYVKYHMLSQLKKYLLI